MKRWGRPPRQGSHKLSPKELRRLVQSAGFRVQSVQLLQAGFNAIYLTALKSA